jgi:hypothetical protein
MGGDNTTSHASFREQRENALKNKQMLTYASKNERTEEKRKTKEQKADRKLKQKGHEGETPRRSLLSLNHKNSV